MTERSTDWDSLARRASAIIGEEEPLRLDFPSGRLFIDHVGTALMVHRCETGTTDDDSDNPAVCSAAHRLVTSQPAYLLATSSPGDYDGLSKLAEVAVGALAQQGRSVLLIELWSPLNAADGDQVDPFHRGPTFELIVPPDKRARAMAEVLEEALSEIELSGEGAEVTLTTSEPIAPPGLPPLLKSDERVVTLGLSVDPLFLNRRDEEFYPGVLDDLRDALAPALNRIRGEFARQTGATAEPLGRRHLEPAAEAVDRGLAEVERKYEFLLQVTPINTTEAWEDFRLGRCESAPELLYRPFTFDPDSLLRQLFALPVDAVEDPTVANLLREKRDEVAVEVQMILDRETRHFLPGSLRLYGTPSADLVTLAESLIARLDADPPEKSGKEVVGATALAAAADHELDYYRERFEGFAGSVQVRKDIPASLMVSHGQLLVGHTVQVSADRVQALLAHEVGTHVLTYYNGCAQPLRQLRYGLAGYEALQEGLAVLAEWLVDGLTHERMRVLAARVIATAALVGGADFVETYRLLVDRVGLAERSAFQVTVRIFRAGGLTKDMIYLQGLCELLTHLGKGGDFRPLLIGKIALIHLPAVEELTLRGVLSQPPLVPHFLSDPASAARLDRARQGLSVLDLL